MLQNQVEVGGLLTNYRFSSPKNPVARMVILHGWNVHGSSSFEEVIKLLSENQVEVFAPDLPAFGKTQAPNQVWGVVEYAFWLDQFFAYLQKSYFPKISKIDWVLAGHSFGGGVSSVYASKFKNNISKLILIAPAIVRKPLSKKKKLITVVTKIFKFFLTSIRLKFLKNTLRKIWYKLLGSQDYLQTQGIKSQIMQKILREDLTQTLTLISTKTLVLWGDKDTYTPITDSRIVLKNLKTKKFIVYKNVNHAIHLNNQQQMVKDILKFLENSF